MNHTEKLILKYDGPGEDITNHEVDVEILGESLLGLSSLIKEVNYRLDGNEDELSIRIKGVQAGSVEYLFDVIQNPQDHLNVLSVIGIGASAGPASLISVMKWLAGRQIDKITITEEGDCCLHVGEDTKNLPSYMKKLIASRLIRKALDKIIFKPLNTESINSFKIMSQQDRREIVDVRGDEEALSFKNKSKPIKEENAKRSLKEQEITFLTIHMDRVQAWRVERNGESMPVAMRDKDFVSRIKDGLEPNLFGCSYSVDLIEWEDIHSLDKKYILGKVHGPIEAVD